MSGRYWDGLDKNRSRGEADRAHRRRSRNRDRDRHRRRYSRSVSRSKSRSRSRSRSRYDRDKRRHHKSHRSSSNDRHHREKREERHKNGDSKTNTNSSSLATNKSNDKSTESTQDGFEFAPKRDENTQYIGGVESEEERKKIHQQMQERLRKLQESEPKRLQPTKPSSSAKSFTPFANDGSFLEKFKEMQERFAQQQETQQRDDERLRLLPMTGRRRGGKILKTGIVEKPKRIEDNPADGPKDAWSLYLQEVKRYKNATCDPDAPSRSLVK